MARKEGTADRNELVVSIASCTMSYSLVDHRPSVPRVDDEAILELTGQIDAITGRLGVPVGSKVSVLLCSARSYPRKKSGAEEGLPAFTISLRKGTCSALFYLPSDVFWGLRPLLLEGQLCQLTLTYGPVRYGSADVISVDFSSKGTSS